MPNAHVCVVMTGNLLLGWLTRNKYSERFQRNLACLVTPIMAAKRAFSHMRIPNNFMHFSTIQIFEAYFRQFIDEIGEIVLHRRYSA